MSDPLIRCSLHDYAVKPANMININNKILSVVLILSIKLPPRVKHWAVCFEVCQDKAVVLLSKRGLKIWGLRYWKKKKDITVIITTITIQETYFEHLLCARHYAVCFIYTVS